MTTEDVKKEVSTARFAPLAVTVAAVALGGAVVLLSEERRVPLTVVLPVLGVLWFAGFGISLRCLKLAGMVEALVDDGE